MTVCFLNGKNTEAIERIIHRKIIHRAFVRGGWGHYIFAYAQDEYDHYYKVDRKKGTYEVRPVSKIGDTNIFIGFNPEARPATA